MRPTRTARHKSLPDVNIRCSYLVLLRKGFTMPSLLPEPRWALTPPFHPYPRGGGLFSVALSVGSRRPAVSRLSAFMEPGLSSPIPLRYGRGHPTLCVCEYIGVLGIINQFSCAPCSSQLGAFIVLTVHSLGIEVHKKCAPAFRSRDIRGISQFEQQGVQV